MRLFRQLGTIRRKMDSRQVQGTKLFLLSRFHLFESDHAWRFLWFLLVPKFIPTFQCYPPKHSCGISLYVAKYNQYDWESQFSMVPFFSILQGTFFIRFRIFHHSWRKSKIVHSTLEHHIVWSIISFINYFTSTE